MIVRHPGGPLRTGASITVVLSPFAPRKPRSFAERKTTLVSAPVLTYFAAAAGRSRSEAMRRPHAFLFLFALTSLVPTAVVGAASPAAQAPGGRSPGRPEAAHQAGRGQEPPLPASIEHPRVPQGRGVAEHRRPARQAGPEGQVRPAGLLDLLLHQLHAHPARAEEAGAGVPRHAGRHRRALGQVRDRTGEQEH